MRPAAVAIVQVQHLAFAEIDEEADVSAAPRKLSVYLIDLWSTS